MLNTILKKIVMQWFSDLTEGHLIIKDKTTHHFGQVESEKVVTLTVHSPKLYRGFVFGKDLGAAASYIQSQWDCDNLSLLFELMLCNQSLMDKSRKKRQKWMEFLSRLKMGNELTTAKSNILKHYDLGNDFFKLFLDDTLSYSCAIYPNDDSTLAQAQQKKLETLCQKLSLNNQDHLLEIGSGWGALALYAAKHYGCQVTTTTISDNQYDYVKHKIKQAGLEHKITLLNQDYRLLSGQYDKLVSVEMIEAIGYRHFPDYFNQCARLLKPNGLFCLQAITINNDRYESYKDSPDFIKKYIFPGGCLPSLGIIEKLTTETGLFSILDIEDIGQHYVRTLSAWDVAFKEKKEQIIQCYGLPFYRAWLFYFAYCIAGFKQSYISDVQVVLQKPS